MSAQPAPMDEVRRLLARIEALDGTVAEQQAALERLARQRRDLLTNVSHDLRTPLAAMQGYLELLLLRHANLEPAERHNYLETATRQSERLSRLVRDLFQWAELDAEDAPLALETFALTELVMDVLQKFALEAARCEVDLGTSLVGPETGAAPLSVHADLGLIDRVLGILAENALQHTPARGAVRIDVDDLAAEGRVRVTVRDSGVGIAAADLEGLFDRYDRTERVAGTSATPHGGLGLAIARRIVQLHGGTLRIESCAGEGTCATFDLPTAARNTRDGSREPFVDSAAQPFAGDGAAAVRSADPHRDLVAPLERQIGELRAALAKGEAARQRAEADLRAVEQRYLLALRGSQDGLWEWDLALNRVVLSPRWKSMLGFASHEITDDLAGWLGRLHPEDRPGFEALMRHHMAVDPPGSLPTTDPQPFDHELRLVHQDGSIRHVLSRGVAIRGADGLPSRIVGLDTDVTRVKRLQHVLDVLAEGTADAHGDDFFPALVRHFGQALGVDLVFVAECLDDPPTRVRTLACWTADRGVVPNFEFELAGTPCEEVLQQGRSCFHREDLARMFPRERGFEAYLGMPILARDGRVLGHLAFFDRVPRGDEMLVNSVHRIFIARAAAEMERSRRRSPTA